MSYRPDSARPLLRALLVGLLLLGAGSAPAAFAQEGAFAGLLETYEARPLGDSVLLRPLDEDSAIRSVEIEEDGEVLVNGKSFDEEELESFLGEDGAVIAALAALDVEERWAALGFEGEAPEAGTHDVNIKIHVPKVVVPPIPPLPEHVRTHGALDDRVSFVQSIHLEEGETASELVCIGCSIQVDGETLGDVVAVGGSIRVEGVVGGNAVAVGGSLVVEDGGLVRGDGQSVGGMTRKEGDGQILGSSHSVGGLRFGGRHGGWDVPWETFGDVGDLMSAILKTSVLALLAVIAFLLLRPAVETAARRVSEEPWKAAFAGILTQLLFFPVLVLVVIVLAVSVIGIPLLLLVPFALLGFFLAIFVGFVGVARVMGRAVERRFDWTPSSALLSVVVGIVAIQAVSLFGRLVGLPGGLFGMAGLAILLFGFFLKYVAWTTGLGAMVLAGLSRDWRRDAAAAAPPPPPPPPVEAGGIEIEAEPEAPVEPESSWPDPSAEPPTRD